MTFICPKYNKQIYHKFICSSCKKMICFDCVLDIYYNANKRGLPVQLFPYDNTCSVCYLNLERDIFNYLYLYPDDKALLAGIHLQDPNNDELLQSFIKNDTNITLIELRKIELRKFGSIWFHLLENLSLD